MQVKFDFGHGSMVLEKSKKKSLALSPLGQEYLIEIELNHTFI
jgi:hypothetical protein